jgi:hypothetical protein
MGLDRNEGIDGSRISRWEASPVPATNAALASDRKSAALQQRCRRNRTGEAALVGPNSQLPTGGLAGLAKYIDGSA